VQKMDEILRCPHCKGDGFKDYGKCDVCNGAGALYRRDGSPATYDDADLFFEEFDELFNGHSRRYDL